MATTAVSAPRPVPAIEMTCSPQATKPPSTTIRIISIQTFIPWENVRKRKAMTLGIGVP